MKLRNLVCLAAVLAGSIGTAHAIPAEWTHTVDQDRKVTSSGYEYFHDIRLDGFRPGVDTPLLATLTIWLFDGENDGSEEMRFRLEDGNWIGDFDVDGDHTN